MAGDDEEPSRSRDHSLLVSSRCSKKRRRRDIPSSSTSSGSSNFSLNDLEVLLTEVLQRLPTAKSAFLCKCVCTNWYSLISTPFFTRRFITQHLKHQYKQNPYAMIINYRTQFNGYELLTLSDEPVFKSRGFKLNYFPERNGFVRVSAIFNDLMLCSVDEFATLKYYICNPFTMQWVLLPSLNYPEDSVQPAKVGFVCEPYYFEDGQGECTINCRYRFRVVLFSKPTESQLSVRTFRSETKRWIRSVLRGSGYRCLTDVVAYNGKLLWYNGKDIFAYDPFNPELSTFVDCSYIESTKSISIEGSSDFCLGVCKGFLHLMQLVVGFGVDRTLTIWKLKDYNTGEWSLEDKVYLLNTMIPESLLPKQFVDGIKNKVKPMCFHPCDGEIVYLQHCVTSIISFNTLTKELKMAGKIRIPLGGYSRDNVFHIELPLWPTPIGTPIGIVPCN